MIYLQEHSLFLHIPRTSGCSLYEAVMRYGKMDDLPLIASGGAVAAFHRHSRAKMLQSIIPEFHEPWFRRFTIVRNPWRLIESNYRFFQALALKLNAQSGQTVGNCKTRFFDYVGQVSLLSFSEFVTTQHGFLIPGGGFYQYFCMDEGRDLRVYPYRFEQIDQCWSELCDLLKLDCLPPRPHVNAASYSAQLNWDASAIAFVRCFCLDDIQRFGYPDKP